MAEKQKFSAEQKLKEYLLKHYNASVCDASNVQLYTALANITKEEMFNRRAKTYTEANKNKKVVHYMSIEFLLGKNLRNNLWNIGQEENFRKLLNSQGRDIDEVYAVEKDAGLGNGGLGRLASCYLDSLAKLGYPAFGHSIKYEYGLFNQKIIDGKQIETPDEWLDTGNVWLEQREDQVTEVLFGGTLQQNYHDGKLSYESIGATVIQAVPYDMMISGYDSNTMSTLRLWSARAKNKFDIKTFDRGEFNDAFKEKNELEAINKVLYPSDNTENGSNLRIVQQYFLVSAAMQNIVKNYFKNNSNLSGLSKAVSIHINDTHPALCIPELMRILVDQYGYGWEESWSAVQKTVSYTNHTILSEALEVKSMYALEKLMPRIALIIKEIDRRFRIELGEIFKNDFRKIDQMAIISGNNVYMANLAIYASSCVNGVSKIHTNILKTRLFSTYADIYPKKFKNVTNGIAYTRWLSQSNPELDKLITNLIGKDYYKDATCLEKLKDYANDASVLNKIGEIKYQNKVKFANFLKKTQNIDIDPSWRYDVQVKRIHEYKRQLMNVLRIIYICNKIKENPDENVTPQVFIFAGKAASGYVIAKRIIKLINQLAIEIKNDPQLSSKIKVVFVENFSVTVSEKLMPATEVTEQISLAGREASGTGNMKAVANGALMLGTVDGANIEIGDKVGHENTYDFGLLADDVERIKNRGYNATEYYINSEKVRSVIDKLNNGLGGESFSDIVDYLLGHSNYKDSYMCLADFDSYIDAHYKMDREYADKELWNKKSLRCIASMGYFSADRAIEEYVSKIWNLKKNEE